MESKAKETVSKETYDELLLKYNRLLELTDCRIGFSAMDVPEARPELALGRRITLYGQKESIDYIADKIWPGSNNTSNQRDVTHETF